MSNRKKASVLAIAASIAFGAVAMAADNGAVVGTWDVVLVYEEREVPIVLTIEEQDGTLQGTWKDPQGEHELIGFRWNGLTLQFAREISRLGRTVKLHYIADVSDGAIEGRMLTPRDELEFSGRRLGSPSEKR